MHKHPLSFKCFVNISDDSTTMLFQLAVSQAQDGRRKVFLVEVCENLRRRVVFTISPRSAGRFSDEALCRIGVAQGISQGLLKGRCDGVVERALETSIMPWQGMLTQ